MLSLLLIYSYSFVYWMIMVTTVITVIAMMRNFLLIWSSTLQLMQWKSVNDSYYYNYCNSHIEFEDDGDHYY